ncbi:Hypothetical predicted protein [Podarcis lilfordi]|uniref:Uncharacterized protein n=1 Tax=Podarcis lilfordi TaxID=74358 RepID=A0AA35L2J3_9SAUR|nr:Hypothetical predicted protein [Podarcis lilfordi]
MADGAPLSLRRPRGFLSAGREPPPSAAPGASPPRPSPSSAGLWRGLDMAASESPFRAQPSGDSNSGLPASPANPEPRKLISDLGRIPVCVKTCSLYWPLEVEVRAMSRNICLLKVDEFSMTNFLHVSSTSSSFFEADDSIELLPLTPWVLAGSFKSREKLGLCQSSHPTLICSELHTIGYSSPE